MPDIHEAAESARVTNRDEVREALRVDLGVIGSAVVLMEQIPLIVRELDARVGRKSVLKAIEHRLGGGERRLRRQYRRAAVEFGDIARDLHVAIDALDGRRAAITDAERRIGNAISLLESHADTLTRLQAEMSDDATAALVDHLDWVSEADTQARLEAVRRAVAEFAAAQMSETSPALLLIAEMRQQVARTINDCRGVAFDIGRKPEIKDADGIPRTVRNPHLERDVRFILDSFQSRLAETLAEYKTAYARYAALTGATVEAF